MTTWIKVYNSMPHNPKMLEAGDRAAWLFVCGLCYANEHLTDGFISRRVLSVVAPGVRGVETLAKRLVLAELWHEVERGWRIHQYGEHQRSAEEVRRRRAEDSARKAAARSAKNPSGVRSDSPQGIRAESAPLDVEVEVEKDNF